MAPIRYSLHYEDYSEHLMSRFGKLLQMQSLVDMTLMCSSHTLRVHKAVLAASSAYFQEVLQKQMGEPLIILKMRFSVLKCLVEFMYCGKTQCLEENLDELVSAAQFLKIKGLSKVTKEGLGIADSGELPVFTPPVVINRPPQSLIDIHSHPQEGDKSAQSQLPPPPSNSQPLAAFGRPSKDTVVRIPFDIENDNPDMPRAIKPRRGRPSVRRSGGWEGAGSLSRAAERALLRREQDSRKAIHQLKHLQTRHMQDYMDRVTLSQAVNSICGPETSSNSYMNMENDLIYNMDQGSSNIDSNMSFGKENTMKDTIPSSYPNASSSSTGNETGGDGISNAMSQYVNALKNAGLPTDLPILFESGDGSYINVNEQVLLDMVQSSEIQYEVIEQPNIIEKVADPSEIKSIDDLSKSIERGEMMQGSKSYSLNADFEKDTDYNRNDDGMNSLNTILPDNLEAYAEQQNFVVMDPQLQENNLDHVSSNDFSCIDGDMQFFTKSMSDDVKKYYEDQQLAEARVMEQLCPTSNSLDTNFSMSLLDAKSSQLNENLSQTYDTLNTDDLRRTEECYDFTLPLPQSNVFKEDLDSLIATPRRNDEDDSFEMNSQLARERAQAKADIIKDLMSIESKMNLGQQDKHSDDDKENSNSDSVVRDFVNPMEDNANDTNEFQNKHGDFSASLTPNMQWMDMDDCRNSENNTNGENSETKHSRSKYSLIDLTGPVNDKPEVWDDVMENNESMDKENEAPQTNEITQGLDQDIPYAVGLLPMKPAQQTEDSSLLKRRSPVDLNSDAKCLKRRAKKKISYFSNITTRKLKNNPDCT